MPDLGIPAPAPPTIPPDPGSGPPLISLSDAGTWVESLPPESTALLFTSPPYPGVRFWEDRGLTPSSILSSVHDVIVAATHALIPGGYSAWNFADVPGGNDGLHTLYPLIYKWHADAGFTLRAHILWDKGQPGPLPPPCFLRRPTVPHLTHEHILVFVKGRWTPREKKITLNPDEKSWNAGSVWRIAPVTGGRNSVDKLRRQITLPFPPELARRIISLFSLPGELVIDPYAGSGTTLLEALKLGRRAAGCDTSPDCVSFIVDQLRSHFVQTSQPATLPTANNERNLPHAPA